MAPSPQKIESPDTPGGFSVVNPVKDGGSGEQVLGGWTVPDLVDTRGSCR